MWLVDSGKRWFVVRVYDRDLHDYVEFLVPKIDAELICEYLFYKTIDPSLRFESRGVDGSRQVTIKWYIDIDGKSYELTADLDEKGTKTFSLKESVKPKHP